MKITRKRLSDVFIALAVGFSGTSVFHALLQNPIEISLSFSILFFMLWVGVNEPLLLSRKEKQV